MLLNNRSFWILILLSTLTSSTGAAQSRQNLDPTIRSGATVKVSDHVYMIPDESKPIVPNVGIVVGDRAALVIDTGLGEANGRIVLAEAMKVAKTSKLYVAATHTHPEHDLGAMAFPEDATLIRSNDQQTDIEESGMGLAQRFAQFSERTAELLEGAVIRPSDLVFDQSMTLDLGGVHVRFLAAGPAHTRGDLAFYVEEDGVLFTGDVVMDQFPAPISPTSSIRHWLAVLDEFEALAPKLIIPSHYDTGSVEMIKAYREYFTSVQSRVKTLAAEGKSPEEAGAILVEEFGAGFSDWSDPRRVQNAVGVAFRELEGGR